MQKLCRKCAKTNVKCLHPPHYYRRSIFCEKPEIRTDVSFILVQYLTQVKVKEQISILNWRHCIIQVYLGWNNNKTQPFWRWPSHNCRERGRWEGNILFTSEPIRPKTNLCNFQRQNHFPLCLCSHCPLLCSRIFGLVSLFAQ